MRVRLTRKLANVIDGVDVAAFSPGDVVDVPAADARLLIAEAWAIPERRIHDTHPESDRRRTPAETRKTIRSEGACG